MDYEETITVLAKTAKTDNIKSLAGQRIFAHLCWSATDYHETANVTPIRLISQNLGYSKYRIRKELSVLEKLDLVKRTTCGFPAYEIYTENGLVDWDESHPPLNGFGLTAKGYDSNTHKKANKILTDSYRSICEST